MNISVNVISANAQAQIKAMQAQLARLQGGIASAGMVEGPGSARQLSALSKYGNQLQWTGRQLQYNFTLPLVIAGAAATHFALENEKAFTRISKVYGDATMSAGVMKSELASLQKAFVALSNHYGVHQSEVLNIAADWAAAGASGVALARGVEQTLVTMVLGEMKAAEATEALIAIQAQYNLSSQELVETIAKLNVVENQTGISLQGLVQGFARAAGVARQSGVDVEHLAAMLAALTPAAGSAAQAGNALKTIISRLAAPTGEGRDLLQAMGIQIDALAWKSANGSQKLEILAKKFHDLDDAQKDVVSATLASRYQINKFGVLMDSIYKKIDGNAKTTGYYGRALEATADRAYYLKQAQSELDAVLSSNPQRLKQIWVILENAMADIIQPMIPLILMAATVIKDLVESFRGLPPELQKAIIMGLLFLALFGPLIRYIGSTMTLLGELAWFFGGAARAVGGLVGMLLTLFKLPFGGAASGIAAIGGGLLSLGPKIAKAARAVFGFMAALPLFRVFGTTAGLIFSALGRQIVQIWTQALARIVLVTGPALAAVQQVFLFWRIGMAKVMTLVAATMALGWTAIVAGARWVGPILVATFSATWAALVAVAKFGITAILVRVRLMWTAMIALFANWRLLIVKSWAMLWAALVFLTRNGLLMIGRALLAGLAALAGPWGIALAVLVTIVIIFRDQIAEAIGNVIEFFGNMPASVASAFTPIVGVFHAAIRAVLRGFYALPEGVRNALLAVVRIVQQAAMAVYELFSYLNPFARHSPSLVENVRNGMAEIRAEFASITNIAGPIKKAYNDIKAFGRAIAGLLATQDRAKQADDRALLAKFAPGAIDEYNRMIANLKVLTPLMERLSAAVDEQQTVVDSLKASLDAANSTLDASQDKLDGLQKIADQASASLDEAQQRLADYANTPIEGMKAMSDQIFANEMAQKRLRLEMMQMEDAVGNIDDLRNNLSKLEGEIELLSGTQADLRAGGAGSEILGQYDDEIDKLRDQQGAINDSIGDYQRLSDELENLQRQGEILDLEKSLKFDELTRQIDEAANAMEEMPFDQIMQGIQQASEDIAKYTIEVDKANKAVDEQQKAVDAAGAARDAIQAQYDAEIVKLDQLKDSYSQVETAIQDVNSALQEMTSAAEDAIRRQEEAARGAAGGGGGSNALDNFGGAAGGNFPDVGGAGGLGREGGLGDQSALIDQFTQDLAKKTGDLFAGFDVFGPIKKKASQFGAWWTTNVNPIFGGIGTIWSETVGKVDWLAPFDGIDWGSAMGNIGDTVKDVLQTAADWGKKIWDLFKDDFQQIWDEIKGKVSEAINQIKPELEKFKPLIEPATKALGNMWDVLKVILAIVGGALLLAFKVITSVIGNVFGPVLDFIVDILTAVIKFFRGWIQIAIGIWNGDWGMIWQGVKDVVTSIWDAIVAVFKGVVKVIWGIISGLVEGIVDFFIWLWDVLVGHSIIPDTINAIVDWFASLPGKVWNALKDLGSKIIEKVKAAWDWWTRTNSEMWTKITTFLLSLPGKAADAIKDLGSKLSGKASEAWNAFKNTSSTVWNSISSWIGGRPAAAASAISGIVGALGSKGTEAMNSMKNGITGAWSGVSSWLGGAGGRIKSAIGGMGSLLYNIGSSVLSGLLSGMKDKFEEIKGFVSGIAGWIKNNKGPIEKDRKLLIDEGAAIMISLHKGLAGEWPQLQSFVKGVAPAIVSAIRNGDPMALKGVSTGSVWGGVGHAEARAAQTTSGSGTVTYGGDTRVTNIYINGNLEFPNIKSSDDAESFIGHLESLAGGGGS